MTLPIYKFSDNFPCFLDINFLIILGNLKYKIMYFALKHVLLKRNFIVDKLVSIFSIVSLKMLDIVLCNSNYGQFVYELFFSIVTHLF